MSRAVAWIASLVAAVAIAPAAAAQAPQQPPAPQHAPARAPAELTLSVSKISTLKGGKRVARLKRRMTVRVVLRPYVEGESVIVRAYRDGRRVMVRRVALERVPGRDASAARLGFTPARGGRQRIAASHRRSDRLDTAIATPRRFTVRYPSLRAGQRGASVRLFQYLLAKRGYAVPRSGRFDAGTGRAVSAFRKVHGLRRITRATSSIFSRLARGGAFKLRHPRAGKHVEVDLSRQVMVLARGGKPYRVYHASTGSTATPTVRGRYRFYRHQPGLNSLGMLHSIYFIRGYAIHGFRSVPVYPASHGCVRIPMANARFVYRWIKKGNPIYVYK